MAKPLIPWENYSLNTLLSALDLSDGGDRTLPEINIDTCLLALVLSEMGWDGTLMDRNLCIPSGPPPDGSHSFKFMNWKGESLNAAGKSFEDIRRLMQPSSMAGFAGPGKKISLEDCKGVLLMESCQPALAMFRAKLLLVAIGREPASALSLVARAAPRL